MKLVFITPVFQQFHVLKHFLKNLLCKPKHLRENGNSNRFYFRHNIEYFCFVFVAWLIYRHHRSSNLILFKKCKMYNFKLSTKHKYSKQSAIWPVIIKVSISTCFVNLFNFMEQRKKINC